MNSTILQGDCRDVLKTLPDQSFQTCVTSPPYWGLRDYGCDGQIGLEKTPELYVAALLAVFQKVKRVLRDDGTLWLNLGDSYAGGGRGGNPEDSPFRKQATNAGSLVAPSPLSGLKPKNLCGIPWRLAFALQADGWWLRSDIIWHKPNPMPESVTDRPTKSHEYIFLMSKSAKYFYDAEAIKEQCETEPHAAGYVNGEQYAVGPMNRGGNSQREGDQSRVWGNETRNKRSVWTVPTAPYREAHFATFPPDLIKPCILAGAPPGGTVLDPFGGSGTTAEVALELGRMPTIIELNPDYVELAENRSNVTPGFVM